MTSQLFTPRGRLCEEPPSPLISQDLASPVNALDSPDLCHSTPWGDCLKGGSDKKIQYLLSRKIDLEMHDLLAFLFFLKQSGRREPM